MKLVYRNSVIPIKKAVSFWQRFRGFSFMKGISHAYLFDNCKSVHSFGMFFNLTLIPLDKGMNILEIKKTFKPMSIYFGPKDTKSIIEIPAEFFDDIAQLRTADIEIIKS